MYEREQYSCNNDSFGFILFLIVHSRSNRTNDSIFKICGKSNPQFYLITLSNAFLNKHLDFNCNSIPVIDFPICVSIIAAISEHAIHLIILVCANKAFAMRAIGYHIEYISRI